MIFSWDRRISGRCEFKDSKILRDPLGRINFIWETCLLWLPLEGKDVKQNKYGGY